MFINIKKTVKSTTIAVSVRTFEKVNIYHKKDLFGTFIIKLTRWEMIRFKQLCI